MKVKKQISQIEKIRHSLAHLLAAAALKIDPKAKLGIGPTTAVGFYYDILFSINISEDILPQLENIMRLLISKNLPFKEVRMSIKQARKLFKNFNQPFKLELLDDLERYGTTDYEEIEKIKQRLKKPRKIKSVTVYKTGDVFVDLCRGGHVENTSEINPDNFKLERIAGAYWRGDEKRPMLTRIYGIAFETSEELENYLKKLAESKKRDHRKLGEDLRLFTFNQNIGPGLTLWLPNGAIIRNLIQEFLLSKYKEYGYQMVFTPHLARENLFEISGHLALYKENMYSPIKIENEKYYLKPMNCPFHLMIYKTWPKSYRDLPIRYGELGTVYRYEKSGTLFGLMRVRGFTQDDGHIICRPDQVKEEINLIVKMINEVLHAFGFTISKVDLSVWDKKNREKYLGETSNWVQAIDALKNSIELNGWAYEEKIGEAAFYGPKIDVKIKDILDREWQLSTLQLDFNLPRKFKIVYLDKDGKNKTPMMIHRAILGSIERFFGILIEHYGGEFPLWLTPLQIVILPLNESHLDYARKVLTELQANNFRVELWEPLESISKRIFRAEGEKIPYMIIIGDKEIENNAISVRKHKVGEIGQQSLKELINNLKNIVQRRLPER